MFLLKKIFLWLCQVAAFLGTFYLSLDILIPLAILIKVKHFFFRYKSENNDREKFNVGIFHPYCNAGAGGERVLWSVIKALQSNYKNVHVYIYTGDVDHDRETILANVEKVFDMKMPSSNISIVYLHRRKWVEAKRYPFCTLLGQSFGSIWLGWEALTLFVPDIYIDTMGYAFTYPLFKYIAKCKVVSYTHYPIISTDMLNYVSQRSVSHNNNSLIAKSSILTAMKLGYYKYIAFLYGLVGRTADIVMVNSTWTKEHINSLWKCPEKTNLLYPPCDVEKLLQLPLLNEIEKKNKIRIISVSQFRPEKNHVLMIEVMSKIKLLIDKITWEKLCLVLIGSCRNKDDKMYLKKLRRLVTKLDVESNVKFKVNISYSDLISEMQKGTIGIHAMWNEHFGISVVDGLAAGLIMVANSSGGPKADIIDTRNETRNGYLANNSNEYAQTIISILNMTTEERDAIRYAARNSVHRFSTKCFEEKLIEIVNPIF